MSDYRTIGWFLNEWIEALGYTQASLARQARWDRQKVSRLCNGQTRYNQMLIEQLALAMGLAPHELLMSPSLALKDRRLGSAETESLVQADRGT